MSYQINLYHSPTSAGHSRLLTISLVVTSHYHPPIISVAASLCRHGKRHGLWWWQENPNPNFAFLFSSFSSLFKEGWAALVWQEDLPGKVQQQQWPRRTSCAAVQVLPHDTKHGPPLAVVKQELCQPHLLQRDYPRASEILSTVSSKQMQITWWLKLKRFW